MSVPLLIKGVKILASLGVTKVIVDVVKTNTITETFVQKVMVNVGSLVIGSMIMDKTSEHVNNAIKTIAEKIEEEKQKEDNGPESSSKEEGS